MFIQGEDDKSRRVELSIEWPVWFLGYGLGGCTGLSLLAGVWSLIVDTTWIPGVLAIGIAGCHTACLWLVWVKREEIRAKSAVRNCFLLGGLGIAATAFLLNAFQSRVPSTNGLYSLAVISVMLAFVLPPQTEKHIQYLEQKP